MKPTTLLVFALATLASGIAPAQEVPPLIEPTPTIDGAPPQTAPEVVRPMIDGAPPQTAPGAIEAVEPVEAALEPTPAPPMQEIPAIPPSQDTTPPAGAFAPLEQQQKQAVQAADGYIIK